MHDKEITGNFTEMVHDALHPEPEQKTLEVNIPMEDVIKIAINERDEKIRLLETALRLTVGELSTHSPHNYTCPSELYDIQLLEAEKYIAKRTVR